MAIPQNPRQAVYGQAQPAYATYPAAAHSLLHTDQSLARYPAAAYMTSPIRQSPMALMSYFQAPTVEAQAEALEGLGMEASTAALATVLGVGALGIIFVCVVRGVAGYYVGKAVAPAGSESSYAWGGAFFGALGGSMGMAGVAGASLLGKGGKLAMDDEEDMLQSDSIFEGAAGYDGLSATYTAPSTEGPQPNDGTARPPVPVPPMPLPGDQTVPPVQTVMPGTWPGVDTVSNPPPQSQSSSLVGDLAASLTFAFFGGIIGYALAPSKGERAMWMAAGAAGNALLGPLGGALVLGGMGYVSYGRRRGG